MEVGRINRRGFNFNVAPSLVGIQCPLISRVGDVRRCVGNLRCKEWIWRCRARVGGVEYGQRVSDQRSELWSKDQGFRSKDQRVRNNRVKY